MQAFETHLSDYLSAIAQARLRKASHDQLRQIFIDFVRKSFRVNPLDIELEKGITGASLRGSVDALYRDIVFEFKRDLKTEGERGRDELTRYLCSLGDRQVTFGILTDGLYFEAYILRHGLLTKIDEIDLERQSAWDTFVWFDAFLFSERQLEPTAQDVVRRFGDRSPVFNSSFHILSRMWVQARNAPSCEVKFREWDKLLAKAYGHSVARDALFLRHTYLSLLVKLLAYTALFRKHPKGQQFAEIINGKAFTNLPNLAEEDFFCWVLHPSLAAEALELLRGLELHLAVYDLSKVNEDLLKELYEDLVDRETKHDLGEVYTPDWLVELTLREASFGKGKRLLDPACGSGTFLFTAIRLLREQGLEGAALVDEALQNIVGVDIHPLAVTISKANYVLALTPDIAAYGKKVMLPVYMSDSLQAVAPVGGEIIAIKAEGDKFFHIPRAMAKSPTVLDEVIDEMRKYVGEFEDIALDGFSKYLKAQGYEDFAYVWRPNLLLMRQLVREGRDTIWAFILRNYYRPAYLQHRPFDIVAGNPPWLSYRYITDPDYQKQVKQLVLGYQLLGRKEVKLFTHLELATLFFTLSADLYLKKGGTIAFVMPRSVLTGAKQHQRFQGLLQGKSEVLPVALEKVVDVKEVAPLFNVPACVLIARKGHCVEKVVRFVLKGTLPRRNVRLSQAQALLGVGRGRVAAENLFPPPLSPSPYLKEIKEGATLVPRNLWFVQPVTSFYGIDLKRPRVETSLDVLPVAKRPWRDVHMEGEVESQYFFATLLSRQLLPFGFTTLSLVVLPLEVVEKRQEGVYQLEFKLVKKDAALARGHSGLYNWLAQAEAIWGGNKKQGTAATVYQWLDYMQKLTRQRPWGVHTLIYSGAGTNLASCIVPPTLPRLQVSVSGFIADADTYYYQTASEAEAHYLCAFLNAPHVDERIKRHQTEGKWGKRHIHRRPFEAVPIPRFDASDPRHCRLAELSSVCHRKVGSQRWEGKSVGFLRNRARALVKQELREIDALVKEILKQQF